MHSCFVKLIKEVVKRKFERLILFRNGEGYFKGDRKLLNRFDGSIMLKVSFPSALIGGG